MNCVEMNPNRFRSEIYDAWSTIVDILGDPNTWGPWASKYRRAFWVPMTYKSRLLATVFCYQNGVSLETLLNFFKALKRSKSDLSKVKGLFDYWNDREHGNIRRSKYFAFDLHYKCFNNLNDDVWRNDQLRYR